MKKIIVVAVALILLLMVTCVSAEISYNAGTNLITLNGSGASPAGGTSWANAYDMEDVLAQCGAVVTKQGANAYDISARILFQTGCYFVSKNEFVELRPSPSNPVFAFRIDSGAHVKFGDYNSTDEFSYNGTFWRIYLDSTTGDAIGNTISGEWLCYGSNLWTDTNLYLKGIHYKVGAKIRVYNSIIKMPHYFWAVDCDYQDVKHFGGTGTYDMLIACGLTHSWAGITTMNCNYGISFSSGTTGNVDVYDVTILNSSAYDVVVGTGISSNWLIRIINSPTVVTVNPQGSGKRGCQLCYTFNVKVTDNNGTPVVGATVELKDVDGTVVFFENTISGGVLANDKIVKWYWFRNVDMGGNKNFNNHTLKVTNGLDVTEYKIKIDHQIKEDVILIHQTVASYDDLYTQNNLLLEEEKMIGTTVLFGIVVFLALLFLVFAVFGVGCESYFDILSAFISPTILMLVGYQCYVSEALQQFEFLGMLFVVIAVIIYIYAVIKVFQLAIEQFGYGQREEDRGADYEYK